MSLQTLPTSLEHIPHRQQISNWDCGLACVSMLLLSLNHSHSLSDLRAGDAARDGVWTIDLAYLLKRFGIEDFTYYTSYIGVNQQYNRSHFYRATFSDDRQRIHSLFAGARESNIRVVAWTLPLDDIIRFLDSTLYAVLILVDLNLLRCHGCVKGKAKKRSPVKLTLPIAKSSTFLFSTTRRGVVQSPESRWWWYRWWDRLFARTCNNVGPAIPIGHKPSTPPASPPPSQRQSPEPQQQHDYSRQRVHSHSRPDPSCMQTLLSCCSWTSRSLTRPDVFPRKHPTAYKGKGHTKEFVGHYILLISYDADDDAFLYRDPGTEHSLCRVDADVLHAARMAPGTDCDVIVVRVR
ncbi:hypothetical protein HKX48_007362 [Thoreauomyces humboldtii]|nr:hypothetical protein HKX48_007362 [Thoreauomyces humboldtii]